MDEMQNLHESKTKFLNSALQVIRVKGYTATRVEDLCAAAGLTKGSFFHHFSSKEDLILAATEHSDAISAAFFAAAPWRSLEDPLDRLLAYIDFRRGLLKGELPEYTCFAGTMVQEIYRTHPSIREACEQSITGHASILEPDIAEAIRKYSIAADWTPSSLALYMQAVLQGGLILAKATGGPEVAAACLDHLRRYLEMLFKPAALSARQWTSSPQACCSKDT
jgi:TetR/AcrR family transcriptional repressor of nem operon